MPKSKINASNDDFAHSPEVTAQRRTPVKLNATGTPRWYLVLMAVFFILGLGWLVVNYVAGEHIPLLVQLGPWNYLIGFAFMIVALLMTMGWK